MSKISIVTVVYNRNETIISSLSSIDRQNVKPWEHLVIDGNSSDGTLETLNKNSRDYRKVFSENDEGIYDALNKGIRKCSGDIVGILHSDDFYSDEHVLDDVAKIFKRHKCDIVYGDINYVSKNTTTKIVRKWKAGKYKKNNLKYGWMPPHPAVFFKRNFIEGINFDKRYKISGDYNWILEVFSRDPLVVYMDKLIVNMRTGGESNKPSKILSKMKEDYMIMKKYFSFPFITLLFKNIRKFKQFF